MLDMQQLTTSALGSRRLCWGLGFRGRERLQVRASAQPRCVVGTVRGGVPKLSKNPSEEHCGTVRILQPSTTGLPFAASLEFVCPCGDDHHDEHEGHHTHAEARHDIVELVYVLSGTGALVEEASGARWPVQAGNSLITWANSTRIVAAEEQAAETGPTSNSSSSSPEPLAVLKFHVPTAMLLEHAVAGAWMTGKELEAHLSSPLGRRFAAAGAASSASGHSHVGLLTDAEALRLLNAAHASTRSGMDNIASGSTPTPTVLSNLAKAPPASPAAAAAATKQGEQQQQQQQQRALAAVPALLLALGGLVVSTVGSAQHAMLGLAAAFTHHAGLAVAAASGLAAAAAAAAVRRLPKALRLPGLSRLALSARPPAAAAAAAAAASPSAEQQHHHHQQANLAFTNGPVPLAGSFSPSAPLFGANGLVASWASGSGSSSGSGQCVLMKRALEEFKTFRFPKQANYLAFLFSPSELGLSLSFGVEVFNPGHHTPLHVHRTGYELFFVLAGEGDAYCDGHHIPVRAGDCIVFPPGTLHGLDNNTDSKLYTLQMMAPDDEFVAYVQSGEPVGSLADDDICSLTSTRC